MINSDVLINGQMILCDMGCKKEGVCSDITCTYPISGKFTQKQKEIYEIVLKAQRNGIDQLVPGLAYSKIEIEANKIILQGLKEVGILTGNVDEMYQNEVHRVFMPHGLGHFIGYRTHDVGPPNKEGKTPEERKQFKAIQKCVLEIGMAFTIEPGIYFIDVLIENSKKSEIKVFFNYEILDQYRKEIGGIRIEDDLAITQDGYVNFTTAPRKVKDIENLMNLGYW